MPWIGNLLEWSAGKTLSLGWKGIKTATTGGLAARMALGAGVGAIGGLMATSDQNSLNGRLSDIGGSVALGALAGAGVWAAPSIAKQAMRQLPKLMNGGLLRAGARGVSMGMKTGAWGIAHPLATIGMVGGGMALYKGMTANTYQSSPTMRGVSMKTNYDTQAIALEQMSPNMLSMGEIGTGPQMLQRRFENSTNGLVQGLSRGRHG